MKPTFFRDAKAFRAWLEKHHAKKVELWMGYYKKSSGKGGLTYRDALDEALCFGWIDGIVKSVDGERYMQRWTPRKSTSHWSNVNVRKFAELHSAGRIASAGRAAFERRTADRTGKASYEQPVASFSAAQMKRLKANTKAWAFYSRQPPSYQRAVQYWATSARQEATRERRFNQFIECSAKGLRVPRFISPVGKK